MGDVNLLYPGEYIKCEDLAGRKVVVTIGTVKRVPVKMQDGTMKKKVEITFEGSERKMIAVKTNGLAIAILLGRDFDKWPGKKLGIAPAVTRAFGKKKACVRVYGSPDAKEGRNEALAAVMHNADRRDPKDVAFDLKEKLDELEPVIVGEPEIEQPAAEEAAE